MPSPSLYDTCKGNFKGLCKMELKPEFLWVQKKIVLKSTQEPSKCFWKNVDFDQKKRGWSQNKLILKYHIPWNIWSSLLCSEKEQGARIHKKAMANLPRWQKRVIISSIFFVSISIFQIPVISLSLLLSGKGSHDFLRVYLVLPASRTTLSWPPGRPGYFHCN